MTVHVNIPQVTCSCMYSLAFSGTVIVIIYYIDVKIDAHIESMNLYPTFLFENRAPSNFVSAVKLALESKD